MLDQNQQIFEQIKKSNNILITFPANWDGDSLASGLAFYLFLKKIGKKVDIISSKNEFNNPLEIPSKTFSFLPSFNQIKRTIIDSQKFIINLNTTEAKIKKVKYKEEKNSLSFIITPKKGAFSHEDVSTEIETMVQYDLIITINTPDLDTLGKLFEENTKFFYETSIINIDHQASNEQYGQINLVNLNTCSSSEILFSLFNNYDEKIINEDMATCLMTGIISKTRNFKTSNITPDTLHTTSQLISKEARREQIVNKLYRSRNIKVLKLWGRVLARLSGTKNNQIIWSTLTLSDFIKTETTEHDLQDIIDELIVNIPEAKIIVIFYEKKGDNPNDAITNFLIHSPKNVNLLDLVSHYNPKGNEKSVAIETKKKMEEIKKEIIDLIDKKIEGLSL